MAKQIVCMENVERYYGANPEMLKKYRQIQDSGKCPFCPGNIENTIVGATTHWHIVHNQYPYKGARLHLLLLPKRHIISLAQLLPEEWADMNRAFNFATSKFPSLNQGSGLAVRDGAVGGVSLYHLHFHLIVPEIGTSGPIPVNFGIG